MRSFSNIVYVVRCDVFHIVGRTMLMFVSDSACCFRLEFNMGINCSPQPKVKERKKHDRFNGMPEEEVSKRTLPDHLATNLDIIIVRIFYLFAYKFSSKLLLLRML